MEAAPGRWIVSALTAGALAAGPVGGQSDVAPAAGGDPAAPAAPSSSGPAYGTYDWPVQGPVIRAFDPPDTAYGSGHRGIDIAAPVGTAIRAPADGVVAFAGPVAGGLFVSIDHPDGVRTTYSWLSAASVPVGVGVRRGDILGRTGQGHAGLEPPHLHLGARYGGAYIDPMLLLARGSLVGLIHLAPLEDQEGGALGG
jgi:murein DD-endopeptidase MepM/ murein hydrolase activator NlpD